MNSVKGDCDRHKLCIDMSRRLSIYKDSCMNSLDCIKFSPFNGIDCTDESLIIDYSCYIQDCMEILAFSEGNLSQCTHFYPKVVGTASERNPYPNVYRLRSNE